MNSIKPLVPLFAAAAILLAGNGLQGTLIALRGAEEGFSTLMIGVIGAAYFAGFMGGCFIVPRILRAVGHIRAFSALCAIAASGTLLLVLVVDPIAWIALRFVIGLCFASLFTTVDSWLNSGVTNENRARVLSIYRLIDMIVVTASQYLIPAFGESSFAIFTILAIMICMSLVPISLADRSNPKPPRSFSFSPTLIWKLSPIACISCIAIGLTNATFRLIGPIYAQSIGLPLTAIATFMGAGILERVVIRLAHLMEENRFIRLGASRRAMPSIGQVAQRRPMGRFSPPLEGKRMLKTKSERAGRFWPLASLARACGGEAPRRATRLARDQNRRGQMRQSNHNSL